MRQCGRIRLLPGLASRESVVLDCSGLNVGDVSRVFDGDMKLIDLMRQYYTDTGRNIFAPGVADSRGRRFMGTYVDITDGTMIQNRHYYYMGLLK